MNNIKEAFDKAYIKRLLDIREVYIGSNVYYSLRYKIAFTVYMISNPTLHDKGIKEAQRIIDICNTKTGRIE